MAELLISNLEVSMLDQLESNNASSNISSNVGIITMLANTSMKAGTNATAPLSSYGSFKYDTVDYKYICIKKEFFDVNMVYLDYTNLRNNTFIEIIYKSPSIYLDGLFFKTPDINANSISIHYKEKQRLNITIKVVLNKTEHQEFIKMLKSIDTYILNYLTQYSGEINNELKNSDAIDNTQCRNINMYRYDNILKYKTETDSYELHLKSYLDRATIDLLFARIQNNKYNFTFNISNIYLSNMKLIPLVKCNKCSIPLTPIGKELNKACVVKPITEKD